MHPTANFLLLLVAATATFSLSAHEAAPRRSAGGAACMPQQRDALLAFKQGITSDPAGLLASWQRQGNEQDCCRWRGVRCSNLTGHVLKLNLRNVQVRYNYFGSREDDGSLVGEISHSLLSLGQLEYLDLSMNYLEGPSGRIPQFLGSFERLRYLNLSGIPFSGTVPPQLGNLSKLHYLDISNGFDYESQLYSMDLSWLARLPLLRYLNMRSVNLSTIVDWPHVVNMIPSLRSLDLSDCSLTSVNQSLPLFNLTNLEELILFWNHFDQPLASCWFWNLTSIKHLNLACTDLYGRFPDALGGMGSLQVLELTNNHDMDMKTLNLKNLCNLRILRLDMYAYPFGNITELIERLPYKLQELYLNFNGLSGPLPSLIRHFASLRTLDLSYNHLTGRVPSEVGMLTNLTKLDLSSNGLDGLITEEHFVGLKSLEYIDLSNNPLEIVVASKGLLPFRLKEAYFASCQMGPLFPAWLKWQVDILRLDISSTGITDRLPDWFCDTFSKVIFLNLSDNQISGGLPTNMEIMSLETLHLSSNQLIGQIPALPRNLTTLDISYNSLSGSLPSNFGAPNLEYVELYSNHINGHIPGSICEMQNLKVLKLANNLLEGELPPCFRI